MNAPAPSSPSAPKTAAARPSRLGHAIGSLVASALIAIPITPVLVGVGLWLIWPGHAQHLPADTICPPGYTNIVVARETWQTFDGTSVSLSVFCQSPDGGVMRPGVWSVIWLDVVVVWSAVTALLWLPQVLRGPRRRTAPPAAAASTGTASAGSPPTAGSSAAADLARAMRMVLTRQEGGTEALARAQARVAEEGRVRAKATREPSSEAAGRTAGPGQTAPPPRPRSRTSTTDSGGWASAPGESLWRT